MRLDIAVLSALASLSAACSSTQEQVVTPNTEPAPVVLVAQTSPASATASPAPAEDAQPEADVEPEAMEAPGAMEAPVEPELDEAFSCPACGRG